MHTNGTVRYNGCAQQPTRCRHRATRPCACAVLRPPSAPHAGRHGPADSRDSAVRATLRPGGASSAQPAPAAASRRAASEPGGTLVGVGRRVARVGGQPRLSGGGGGWGTRGIFTTCNGATRMQPAYVHGAQLRDARGTRQAAKFAPRCSSGAHGHPIPRSTGRPVGFTHAPTTTLIPI